tara:strand:+ start:469 stop:606 length:138 start_codon:yes stop_codon:yes gene_type:complete
MENQQYLSFNEKITNAKRRIKELERLIKVWESKRDRLNHTRAEIK